MYFCVWCKILIEFHSFACGDLVFPTLFIEKTVFSLLYILGIFVVNYLTMYAYDYFWVSSLFHWSVFRPIQCCSVTHLCPSLCDPMYYSTPGFPVLHCWPSVGSFKHEYLCECTEGIAIKPFKEEPVEMPLNKYSLNSWVCYWL